MSQTSQTAVKRVAPKAETRIASYLLTDYLERLGVEVIFGLCGHTVIGFLDALDKVRQIFETGGKGHSCGIYSFNDDHIHRLALTAPVSRIMVRQVQSSSNAGTFTNGMPMTSSMGCGVWGGNITNENISLKHYMNVTWVSHPIPEDRPSEQELFGEFYNSPTFDPAAV